MSQSNDYGSNPYYGNGAGGGGGYLTGGSPFGSAGGSPGSSARRGVSHSLRPVTLKQLLTATQAHSEAEWMIGDVEAGQVTVVAHVMSVQVQTTNRVYWLDDGTGRMEARHWVDSGSEDDSESWESKYIRVTGSLKSFGNKRYINATLLRLTTDPHELYFHILEAMTVTHIFHKGAPPRPSEGGKRNAIAANSAGQSAYTAQSHSTTDGYGNLPALQQQIIRFIAAQPPNDEGVHVATIARSIGAGNPGNAHAISEALDELMDQGFVFTTIDDSHFSLSIG
ncbi:Replication factor A protein 2 [Grifola frondosa]|uniref:Replication factor A protein 2 n=1 Tax=Grifola frondosa TaxID=5627 RepID=A0A1C7MEW9_GRIFR|nr:Replication factor A protein 2 [Grifola frondosa]